MRIYYDGSFFGLLNPFALLCGLVSLSMLLMHGASWLVFKTEGEVAARAASYGMLFAVLTTVLFAAAGVWLAALNGYHHQRDQHHRPVQPAEQDRCLQAGAWMANFQARPVLWPCRHRPAHAAAGGAGPAAAPRMAGPAGQRPGDCRHHPDRGRSMFPFILPSSLTRAQPDGLGLFVQPCDAVHHAGVRADLPAPDRGLHQLGVQRAARQGRPDGHHRRPRPLY
jgi:cytochrome d ubiquinol oxidase subunit II